MSSHFWFILRLAIIASFFASGFDPEWSIDDRSVPPVLIIMIFATTPLVAVIQYAGLTTVKKTARPTHDWNASLWFSPLFKNPLSFMLTGALAMTALGLSLSINHLVWSGRNPVVGGLALSMGLGTLASLLAFRLRHTALEPSK